MEETIQGRKLFTEIQYVKIQYYQCWILTKMQSRLFRTFVWTLGSFISDSRFTLLNWSSLLDLKSRYLMGALLQNIDKVECNEGKVAIELHFRGLFCQTLSLPYFLQFPNEQVLILAYEFQIWTCTFIRVLGYQALLLLSVPFLKRIF